ncbi:MAG: hypothetical protein RJQ09_13910 [Cyclobacteriaceae bacterium]
MNVLFFILLLITESQNSKPEKIVDDFYKWYVEGGYLESKPRIIETSNGGTGLDYNIYKSTHRKMRFADDFIDRSFKVFQNCGEKLAKIPYTEFRKIDDIEEFEKLDCSFQFWQWFGLTMEPYDHHEIGDVIQLSTLSYKVLVHLFWNNSDKIDRSIPVTVELRNRKWIIVDIEVERPDD